MDGVSLFNVVWQTALVVAISFLLLLVLSSHLKYQHLLKELKKNKDYHFGANALELGLSQYLGTLHRNPDPFTLGIVRCEYEDLADYRDAFMQNLRIDEDAVYVHEQTSLAFIVNTPKETFERSVQPRLEAFLLNLKKEKLAAEAELTWGMAFHPEHGETSAELIAQAMEHQGACTAAATPPDAGDSREVTHHAEQGKMLDPVTGVLHSRHYFGTLQRFVAQQQRDENQSSLILFDVDGLDQYNELYGKALGDELLRAVAEYLGRFSRESDIIARAEEDSFAIISTAELNGAVAAAKRLVEGLRKHKFIIQKQSLRITVCAGIVATPPLQPSGKILLAAAEEALQRAKARGRSAFEALLEKERQRTVYINEEKF